jgi:hypothetical protein
MKTNLLGMSLDAMEKFFVSLRRKALSSKASFSMDSSKRNLKL